MKRCRIPLETLLDAREGRLDADARARYERHRADGCDRCDRRAAWLDSVAGSVRGAAGDAAPERALAAARQIFRDFRPTPAARVPFLARLVFDSRTMAPGLARRAAGDAVTRLFETDAHVVDLWEEGGSDGTASLMGQVVALPDRTPVAPDAVLLVERSGAVRNGRPDGDAFLIASVPAGRYTLQLTIGATLVRLPDLEVGQAEP